MKTIKISEKSAKILTFGFVFALLAMVTGMAALIINGHTSYARGFTDQIMSIGQKSIVITLLVALCADYIDKKN